MVICKKANFQKQNPKRLMAEKEMRNTAVEKMRLRRNIESGWLIYMRRESGSEERKRCRLVRAASRDCLAELDFPPRLANPTEIS